MSRNRLSAIAAVVLLLSLLIGVSMWYVSGPETESSRSHTEGRGSNPTSAASTGDIQGTQQSAAIIRYEPGAEPERPALDPVPPAPLANPEDRSPLADNLNSAETTGVQDLEIVHNLFDAYRERFGGIPTGEDNAAIVNAFTGNNPRRLAFIERSHPAINAKGEIVDRWGSPLFFHLEARDAWEIRSAGPDREMYTADDLRKRSRPARGEGL